MVKTKIICILGPASSSETKIRKMMRAGMDVARLNFTHGKPPELVHRIGIIRLLNEKYRRRMKILGDLRKVSRGQPVETLIYLTCLTSVFSMEMEKELKV